MEKNLAELVLLHTQAWANEVGISAPDPKDAEWLKLFQDNPGHQDAFHIALVEKLTGANLQSLRNHALHKFWFGVAIVPTANHNAHNYDIGKPIICYKGSVFMRSNGEIGNHMDMSPQAARLATLEEIEKLLKAIHRNSRSFYNKIKNYMENEYGE